MADSTNIFLTLGVVVVALIFFIGEWFPIDFVAICVAVVLILLKLVTPEQGIAGFSNNATITVMAMFILSAGISRTGAIQIMRDLLLRWGGKNQTQQMLVMGSLVGTISAFINNTAVVAVFLPIVEDWCRKQRIAPSQMLIPLSYVTILGGMITVIGTSTNVLASGISEKLGYGQFGLFDFTVVGILTFLTGLIFLALFGSKLLPNHKVSDSDNVGEEYYLQDYVSEIIIPPTSSLIGQTLRESGIQRKFDLDVLEIIRDDNHFPQPLADQTLSAGDILIVRGKREDLLKIRDEKGIEIVADVIFKNDLSQELTEGQEKLAEVLILSNSRLIGSTLKELRFRQRYNATVLAIRRGEELVRERLGKVSLRFGDLLLVQGPKDSFIGLQTTRELLVLEQRDVETLKSSKAWISVAIISGVVLLAAFEILPILVSSLIGVILMVLTGCLKPGELYGSIRWDVIFLLAGLIPLGTAMDNSGATEWLAKGLVSLGGSLSGFWILFFFYVITSLLTEILSNNAAVVLMIPIAVKVAETLNLNPYAFMIAITFAASNSFMTPIGYQTNTMVYGAGGYKFMDFVKIGAPMNILLAIVAPILITWWFGLAPIPKP
ncbi:SLC13 family permease [Aphanothece hegewaldii CCALA 016]|uniref:SLC13 family permease n=1 Tax=Aphanothece hegewaldii CCALA 016 TaxID=2107694 RepID=A0A2T1LWK5_9CHRO|nr:SLC13 family permease [Aphanothece hegewaldii]PSF36280.1 SLC13 family permease [Aphanothece hegewaldii CCALA 016]